MGGECLGEDIPGLGHRALGGVDEEQHAVHERQRPLHLAAEVGMAGCIDQVDPHALPLDRRRLGEDRDPALALLVVGVHDALDRGLVGGEHPGGLQHCIHEGGLAVVDVRDQGDIAKGGGGHEAEMVAVRAPL